MILNDWHVMNRIDIKTCINEQKKESIHMYSFLSFLVFGHFWRQSDEYTKILRNLCLHFARQDGQQDGKTGMHLK